MWCDMYYMKVENAHELPTMRLPPENARRWTPESFQQKLQHQVESNLLAIALTEALDPSLKFVFRLQRFAL